MRQEMTARSEEIPMEDVSGDSLLKEIPVLMYKNLTAYISSVFLKLQEGGNSLFADPDSTVQIAIGGDKCGDSMVIPYLTYLTMKFHSQIYHPETSVVDVHIFICMKA